MAKTYKENSHSNNMIKKGDSWQNNGTNKFFNNEQEEHGILVAVSQDGTEGIIDGLTGEFTGKRILVRETQSHNYPTYERESGIPDDFNPV